MDGAGIERLLDARAKRRSSTAGLCGPVTVLASEPRAGGGEQVHVQASRLVAVDPGDATLADISIPVPVSATVAITPTGRLGTVRAEPGDPGVDDQARAFARNLIATGAVRGLAATGAARRGPPTRPTHEVTTDQQGRRVIRRVGFSIGPPVKRASISERASSAQTTPRPRGDSNA
jgi:hypothetical protein